jgi:tRNA (uracil-5-)-methyltransferase TRM9
MDSEVRSRLQQLTTDFYAAHAESFDESRTGAWECWETVTALLVAKTGMRSLLDIGCGNGRFAGFLDATGLEHVAYTGIDSEPAFIARAQQRYPAKTFVEGRLETSLDLLGTFDAVVSFGVLHHVAGLDERRTFLDAVAHRLNGGGIAALSFWQPKRLSNFASKVSSVHNVEGLEPNDFLLGWKGDFDHVRYCHHFDDEEVDHLIETSSLKLVDRFNGIGNDVTNLYVIVSK